MNGVRPHFPVLDLASVEGRCDAASAELSGRLVGSTRTVRAGRVLRCRLRSLGHCARASREGRPGARARAAVRAAECGAHRDHGFADPSEWLAREAGTTARSARGELDTVKALELCPDTRDALTSGNVSLAQAGEIARTVAKVPGSEAELLAVARSAGLSQLREKARTRRVAAIPAEKLYNEQRAVREVRHRRDELGMVSGTFRLTPDVGVPLMNRLERDAQRLRRAARRRGDVTERFETNLADAFVAAITGPITPGKAETKTRNVDLVIVCDLNAYRRGHAHRDEVSHIVGGGPIPVAVARDITKDAFLKAVIHDGIDIHTAKHFGRHVTAALRTALELGPLPELDGVTRDEAACDRQYGLEWDHVDPVANGGPTSAKNLKPRCGPHHWEKTERDRLAGRLGAPRTRGQPRTQRPP